MRGKESMETPQELFELLKQYGGQIISSNNMTVDEINESRAGGRFYVDDDGFGFSWELGRIPTTVKEVEMFEKWYPSPVDQSKIPTFEAMMLRVKLNHQRKYN